MTTFVTEQDKRNQNEVAAIAARAWGCEVVPYPGTFAEVDFYARVGAETKAALEIKTRQITTRTYPTIFLSLRKFQSLVERALPQGIPGVYMVRFDLDGEIRWIDVCRDLDIPRGSLTMDGNSRREAANDIEPMIHVPVDDMRVLTSAP